MLLFFLLFRLHTPPSGSLSDSLAFLESVRVDPPSTLRRMKSIRRPRRKHPISALTLPEGVPSPFESPAVLARLAPPSAQESMLTLPMGIPSPSSPGVQPLSDISNDSSNKIFDDDDAVSTLGKFFDYSALVIIITGIEK